MEKLYQIKRIYTKKASFHNATEMPTNWHECWIFKEISEMIKILFICHGNICRSPMSEFILKDMVEKRGIKDKFDIASAATSTEEIWNGKGNSIYPPAQTELKKHGIGKTAYTNFSSKRARQVTKQDYNYYDYLLCADSSNIRNTIRITGPDTDNKIKLLLDYTDRKGSSIADPWYSGNFVDTYRDVVEGCEGFLAYLESQHII